MCIRDSSKHRRVDNSKRHVKQFRNGPRQQGLSRTCRAHHNDIALLDFHAILILRLLQPLIVVIDGHRKETLGLVLSDDILIEIVLDVDRLRYRLLFEAALSLRLRGIGEILLHNPVGLLCAVLADIAVHTGDEQPALPFRPSAETTCLLYHYFFLMRTLSIIP